MTNSLSKWNHRSMVAGVVLGDVGAVLNSVAGEYSWALLCACSATVSMVALLLTVVKKEK